MDLYTSLQIAFASSKKTADYSVHVYTTDDICEHELSILDRLPVSNILSVVTVSSLKEFLFPEIRISHFLVLFFI